MPKAPLETMPASPAFPEGEGEETEGQQLIMETEITTTGARKTTNRPLIVFKESALCISVSMELISRGTRGCCWFVLSRETHPQKKATGGLSHSVACF